MATSDVRAVEQLRNAGAGLGDVIDPHPAIDAHRADGAVLPGSVASLLGVDAPGMDSGTTPTYSVIGFEAAEAVFKDNVRFSSNMAPISDDRRPGTHLGETI